MGGAWIIRLEKYWLLDLGFTMKMMTSVVAIMSFGLCMSWDCSTLCPLFWTNSVSSMYVTSYAGSKMCKQRWRKKKDAKLATIS
jgi:hypothetical protein